MIQEDRNPYLIKSVIHASDLLRAFQSHDEPLRLRDIVARTHLSKGIVFRLLYTLEQCGLVEKIGDNLYRGLMRPCQRRKFKIGYASQGTEDQFTECVTRSLRTAVDETEGLELLTLSNRYDRGVAIRNAEHLVRDQVDLVIEFQTDETVAPVISSIYRDAKIPFIAVDIPHPGATYYGANNYQAGLIAGEYMGKWAKQMWHGAVDEIVMMELQRAGAIPKSRLTGMVTGIKSILKECQNTPVIYLDGDGLLPSSWEAMRKHLRGSRAKGTLVGAINDPSALGALRAFEEAGRLEGCAVMGQNGSLEAREEMRRGHSHFIGSVTFHPERYGGELIRLAVDILNSKTVPPAVFTQHLLMTPRNVDKLYPNDALFSVVRS